MKQLFETCVTNEKGQDEFHLAPGNGIISDDASVCGFDGPNKTRNQRWRLLLNRRLWLPLFSSFGINGCDDAVCGVRCNKRLTLFQEKQSSQQKFQSFFSSIWMNKNAYRHATKAEDKQSYSQSQWKFFEKIADNTGNKNSFTQIDNRFSNNFKFSVTHCERRLSCIV